MDGHPLSNVEYITYALSVLDKRGHMRTDGRMVKNKFSGKCRMEGLPDRILNVRCDKCRYIEEGLYRYSSDDSYFGRMEWNKFVKLASLHDPTTHNEKVITKYSHEGNGAPSGTFAGTLTKAPDWEETEEDMVVAIEKIMSQKTCPVDKYSWYVEYTDNGLPHIHFIYNTVSGGRIHAKVFKRYWKQWDEKRKLGKGHQGGYHRHVESEMAYLEYIEKDSGRHGGNWSS